MTTYRTGNHWGVTIVRESLVPNDNYGEHDQLVAVVVNGDQALAERICRLLNDDRHPLGWCNPRGYHPTCIEVTNPAVDVERKFMCGPDCPPSPSRDDLERADVRRRIDRKAEHRPEIIGPDGFGYGRCAGCREVWPCTASRGEVSP